MDISIIIAAAIGFTVGVIVDAALGARRIGRKLRRDLDLLAEDISEHNAVLRDADRSASTLRADLQRVEAMQQADMRETRSAIASAISKSTAANGILVGLQKRLDLAEARGLRQQRVIEAISQAALDEATAPPPSGDVGQGAVDQPISPPPAFSEPAAFEAFKVDG